MKFVQSFDRSFPEEEALRRTAEAYMQACRRTEGGEPEDDFADRMRIDRDVPPPAPLWVVDENGERVNAAPAEPVHYLVRVNH